jgi:hypothetical protein
MIARSLSSLVVVLTTAPSFAQAPDTARTKRAFLAKERRTAVLRTRVAQAQRLTFMKSHQLM